jgi:hypothetical protein
VIGDWYLTGTSQHETAEEALIVARQSKQICIVRNAVVNYVSALPRQHNQKPFKLERSDILVKGSLTI